MAAISQEEFLNVLQSRNVPFSEKDLARAFADPQTHSAAEAFVRDHLQPSTLLTKDEFEFHQHHAVSLVDGMTSLSRPLADDELETTIQALEASTAAIERQSRLLESQREALHEIKSRSIRHSHANNNTRHNDIDRQSAQLDIEIDEVAQNVAARLRSACKQADAATTSIPAQVERLLEKDDRLLDGLQKLLPKVSNDLPDGEEPTTVEQLCSVLAALTVKEIKVRLDRAYQDGMNDYDDQTNGSISKDLNEQQRKQHATLRVELEELGGEIDGLVGILVDYQYRKPLKQSQMSALNERLNQQFKWSEYTVSGLAYLTARLDAINEHAHMSHAHRDALQGVSVTLENMNTPLRPNGRAATSATPQPLDRYNGRGLKPLKLVQANLSEGQDPAIQLLRQHEVRVTEGDSTSKLGEALFTTLRSRTARLSNLSKSVEHATTDAMVQSLAKSDSEAQDLLAALYAHSTSSEVRLVAGDVQSNLNDLELDTQRLGAEIRNLDTDAIARMMLAKQDEVIRTLARSD